MVYYRSYNRYYLIQGVVGTSLIVTLIWFAQNVGTQAKVVTTCAVVLTLFVSLAILTLPSIVIDDRGIELDGRYAGPLNSLSLFNPYELYATHHQKRLEWDDIKNIRFGYTEPLRGITNIILRPYVHRTYLIITTLSTEIYVAEVMGSALSFGWAFEKGVTKAITKAHRDNLVVPEVARL